MTQISVLKILNNGSQINKEITKEFICKLVTEQGVRVHDIEHDGEKYSLWEYPKKNPEAYYILSGSRKKALRISLRKIIPHSFKECEKQLKKIQELETKLEKYRKKHKKQMNNRELLDYINKEEIKCQ